MQASHQPVLSHSTHSNFKKWAVEPAISKINNYLTRLTLKATNYKIGHTVSEVEITWKVKKDLTEVKA
jgi:hypothetical protein